MAVQWEEEMEFVGSRVCLDGNSRHAIARRSAQANKCLPKWRPVFEFIMAPEGVALEHCEIDNVAGLSLEFERVDDGESPKRQRIGLDCEIGGERDQNEEAPVDGNGSVVETFAQDWSPLDREMQRECADSRQRTRALLGWSRGQNGHSQI